MKNVLIAGLIVFLSFTSGLNVYAQDDSAPPKICNISGNWSGQSDLGSVTLEVLQNGAEISWTLQYYTPNSTAFGTGLIRGNVLNIESKMIYGYQPYTGFINSCSPDGYGQAIEFDNMYFSR